MADDRPEIRTETRGRAAWIWIDREDRRNAMNKRVVAGIERAVIAAAEDPAIRAIVLTGAGRRAFCAGADLSGGTDTFILGLDEPKTDFGRLARTMRAIGIPTIARVNGDCVAGGMGLMAMCDLAVAADHARFGLPEAKVGVFPMQVLVFLRGMIGARAINESLPDRRVHRRGAGAGNRAREPRRSVRRTRCADRSADGLPGRDVAGGAAARQIRDRRDGAYGLRRGAGLRRDRDRRDLVDQRRDRGTCRVQCPAQTAAGLRISRPAPPRPRGRRPAPRRSRSPRAAPSGSARWPAGSADGTGSRAAERSGSAPRRRPACALRPIMLQVRDRVQQQPRIGMARRAEDRLGRTELDDAAEIHHPQPVRHVAHHRQVVADEQVGQAQPRLQVAHQVQDLRLHRHIERAGRFVADQELGLATTGRGRSRCAGAGRRRIRAGISRRPPAVRPTCASSAPTRSRDRRRRAAEAEGADRLGDDVAHPPARVERGVRVLEDHVHPPPQRRSARGRRTAAGPRSGFRPRSARKARRPAARWWICRSRDSPTSDSVVPRAMAKRHVVHRAQRRASARRPACAAATGARRRSTRDTPTASSIGALRGRQRASGMGGARRVGVEPAGRRGRAGRQQVRPFARGSDRSRAGSAD